MVNTLLSDNSRQTINLQKFYYNEEEIDEYEFYLDGIRIKLKKKVKRSVWQRIKEFFKDLIYSLKKTIKRFFLEVVIEEVAGPVIKFFYMLIEDMGKRQREREQKQIIYLRKAYVVDANGRFLYLYGKNLVYLNSDNSIAYSIGTIDQYYRDVNTNPTFFIDSLGRLYYIERRHNIHPVYVYI